MPKYTRDNNPFKTEQPDLEKRKQESTHVKAKFPNRCAVIVYSNDDKLPKFDKYKYVVPDEITIAQFMQIIRKKIKLDANQSIFMYVADNVLPATSATLATICQEHLDEDGFLYINVVGENVFG